MLYGADVVNKYTPFPLLENTFYFDKLEVPIDKYSAFTFENKTK